MTRHKKTGNPFRHPGKVQGHCNSTWTFVNISNCFIAFHSLRNIDKYPYFYNDYVNQIEDSTRSSGTFVPCQYPLSIQSDRKAFKAFYLWGDISTYSYLRSTCVCRPLSSRGTFSCL